MQIPATPFDAKLEEARTKEEDYNSELAKANAERSRFLQEGEALMREREAAGLDPNCKKLEKIRGRYEGAVGDYLQADRLRLRARARRTALEAARERYLLQEHGIFPDRKRFPTVTSEPVTEPAATEREKSNEGVPASRAGNGRTGSWGIGRLTGRSSTPGPRAVPGMKSDHREPERKDRSERDET